MRYKAAAKKLRQVVELPDPIPVAAVLDGAGAVDGTGAREGTEPKEGRRDYGAEKSQGSDAGEARSTQGKSGIERETAVLRARGVYLEAMEGVPDVVTRVLGAHRRIVGPRGAWKEATMLASWRARYARAVTGRTAARWRDRLFRPRRVGVRMPCTGHKSRGSATFPRSDVPRRGRGARGPQLDAVPSLIAIRCGLQNGCAPTQLMARPGMERLHSPDCIHFRHESEGGDQGRAGALLGEETAIGRILLQRLQLPGMCRLPVPVGAIGLLGGRAQAGQFVLHVRRSSSESVCGPPGSFSNAAAFSRKARVAATAAPEAALLAIRADERRAQTLDFAAHS